MSKKGIAIVGRMAQGVQLLDGQTVKTKVLYEELRRQFPTEKFVCVDTYQYRKNIVPILLQTIYAFATCEHFFVLLSRNGRKFFFPILNGCNAFFHRRLYHDVIGGALPEEAKNRPGLVKQLQKFEINWVEVQQMKDALAQLGVTNVEVLPNFKRLDILDESQLHCTKEPPFIFSMFSRVTKEKGMTVAIEATMEVNHRFGGNKAMLHIYGPVEESYKEEFEQLLKKAGDCVCYKGCVPHDQSVEALRNSFMLLFPSVYPGEGIPGTIIDAFSAGIPVIATDWHFNGQLVQNGVNGYCYDWRKQELLVEHMLYAISHPEEIESMGSNCLKEARNYTPEVAMEQIKKRMEKGGK